MVSVIGHKKIFRLAAVKLFAAEANSPSGKFYQMKAQRVRELSDADIEIAMNQASGYGINLDESSGEGD